MMSSSVLKAPFPYFGGKSRAAHLFWQGFGDVKNYVEPFAGSLAAVLSRPNYNPSRHTETVNDLDCYLSNFWRALQSDPESVAYWCDQPVNEADLHARHTWLSNQFEFRERMHSDPDYYDSKIAGWWVWGLCASIGAGWCAKSQPPRGLPHLGDNEQGVHRQLPHLGNNGRGVHRQLPHLGSDGESQHSADLYEYFEALANRLRRVRVACGDWTRVLGPSVTERIGITGVVLDPPYEQTLRSDVYRMETPVSAAVREWAIANGTNPRLRIALCGYADEHEMPADWQCVAWKAGNGYSGKDNENRKKERIWFSPHCLQVCQDEELNRRIAKMHGYGRLVTYEQALRLTQAA
ncbi:DNA adenine methylase [Leptolyngbya sp. FACHB-36]|uniref:DNA adenine methylase n=1 Tax=Leptolyngbya sp. FACHB-36 TaxID=2692808 RepID=UPI00167FEDB7|nr:DNA adenine methylase [Leptolyngbya sp. FACHB-36]MBD2019169.1 DNA adenine methylase [Leptolyngbya sp. FACHB-36]